MRALKSQLEKMNCQGYGMSHAVAPTSTMQSHTDAVRHEGKGGGR